MRPGTGTKEWAVTAQNRAQSEAFGEMMRPSWRRKKERAASLNAAIPKEMTGDGIAVPAWQAEEYANKTGVMPRPNWGRRRTTILRESELRAALMAES